LRHAAGCWVLLNHLPLQRRNNNGDIGPEKLTRPHAAWSFERYTFTLSHDSTEQHFGTAMRKRDKRLIFIVIGATLMGGAIAFASVALRDTVSLFYGPSDAVKANLSAGTSARIGGLVAANTVVRGQDGKVDFVVTDGKADLKVSYQGVLPDLFREGQGVMAEGRFVGPATFKADRILAKHDENYMPKEVVEALKKSGEWRPAEAASAVGNGYKPT